MDNIAAVKELTEGSELQAGSGKKRWNGKKGNAPSGITHRQDLLREWHAAPPLRQLISFLIFQ